MMMLINIPADVWKSIMPHCQLSDLPALACVSKSAARSICGHHAHLAGLAIRRLKAFVTNNDRLPHKRVCNVGKNAKIYISDTEEFAVRLQYWTTNVASITPNGDLRLYMNGYDSPSTARAMNTFLSFAKIGAVCVVRRKWKFLLVD